MAKGSVESTRCLHWLQLKYDENGYLEGAENSIYFIDSTKIRGNFKNETNYNIFYMLFSGLSIQEKDNFDLSDVEDYVYLYRNHQFSQKLPLQENYKILRYCLYNLNISTEQQCYIFQTLAAILHLGNVKCISKYQKLKEEIVDFKNFHELSMAADYFGMDVNSLASLIKHRSKKVGSEKFTIILDAKEAENQKNYISQLLYIATFYWILDKINDILNSNSKSQINLIDLPASSSGMNIKSNNLEFNCINDYFSKYVCHDLMKNNEFLYNDNILIEKSYMNNTMDFANMHLGFDFLRITCKDQDLNYSNINFSQISDATLENHTLKVKHWFGDAEYNVEQLLLDEADSLFEMISLFIENPSVCCNQFLLDIMDSYRIRSKFFANVEEECEFPIKLLNDTFYSTDKLNQRLKTKTTKVENFIRNIENHIEPSEKWFVLCLYPFSILNNTQNQQSNKQVINHSIKNIYNYKNTEYTIHFTHSEFCLKYNHLSSPLDTKSKTPLEICKLIYTYYNWKDNKVAIGSKYIHFNIKFWMTLEINSQNNINVSISNDHTSNFYKESRKNRKENESKRLIKAKKFKKTKINIKKKQSFSRKIWMILTWSFTFWILTFFLKHIGKMRDKQTRIAWREKVTLFMLSITFSIVFLIFSISLPNIISNKNREFGIQDLNETVLKENAFSIIRGNVYDIDKLGNHYGNDPIELKKKFAGKQINNLFPQQINLVCERYDLKPISPNLTMEPISKDNDYIYLSHDFRYYRKSDDPNNNFYEPESYNYVTESLKKLKVGIFVVDREEYKNKLNMGYNVIILNNKIYDLTNYIRGRIYEIDPKLGSSLSKDRFLDPKFIEIVLSNNGLDITQKYESLYRNKPDKKKIVQRCLNNLFLEGKVDEKNSLRYMFSKYFSLSLTLFIFMVVFVKFMSALNKGSKKSPINSDKYLVINIPCYTENIESIEKTVNSIAKSIYNDRHKLLFIICDGMVIGSGNEEPTPNLVLKLFGIDYSRTDNPSLKFYSIGEGEMKNNRGKVYTGQYSFSGHSVPFIVVIKTGNSYELNKPGNRGKRDSQLLLMKFFNKVHYKMPLNPLEYEIYNQINTILKIDPSLYEYVLMVDADTFVLPNSLYYMISEMEHDISIVGLCGETCLENGTNSWVSMIQIYEYYMSHYLGKSFESLFGSVMCLPGCFCLYRIKSKDGEPLLVNNDIITNYSINEINTLHMKNLLELGEDRYLTTIMIKRFPFYKTTFTKKAKSLTTAPDKIGILLSQRRRWVNSTIHNLFELIFVPNLCRTCCFSMKLIVLLDLFSIFVMPAILVYIVYILYLLFASPEIISISSASLIIGQYLLQVLLILFNGKIGNLIWLFLYVLALPFFSFILPLYSMWHFDDFSWGTTRLVSDNLKYIPKRSTGNIKGSN